MSLKFEGLKDFKVGGYLPASFLDWEGHVSASVFVSGCNFRCPWCHNGALVSGDTERLDLPHVLSDIERRAKFLDGVVLSGGEPTIWDGLFPFLEAVRGLGLPLKLDTNGSMPDVVGRIIDEGLAECVAMDIKAPFDSDSLSKAAGVPVRARDILRSAEIIKSRAQSYEFRTTWSPDLLSADELKRIEAQLGPDSNWVVQLFRPVSCLDPSFEDYPAAKESDLLAILPGVRVRG
jgi:pyruvate formate lyase activating enzyme